MAEIKQDERFGTQVELVEISRVELVNQAKQM